MLAFHIFLYSQVGRLEYIEIPKSDKGDIASRIFFSGIIIDKNKWGYKLILTLDAKTAAIF